MKLIIVESPAKARKIQGFLGRSEYIVKASFGHIRDLPDKEIGVDWDDNFKPKYVVKNTKIANDLKREAAKCTEVILAADDDREGEAIAYHLAVILKLSVKTNPRIIFHEITPRAVKQALENPKTINMSLVDSQQGRRLLDRLVGYLVSPCVQNAVAPKTSAGRVQSFVLDLCVKREEEVNEFLSKDEIPSHWTIEGYWEELKNHALGPNQETEKDSINFMKECHEVERWFIEDISEEITERKPPPPYTTSVLQQDLCPKLRISNKRLMDIAQKLYENGFITYHRTDSKSLSPEFISKAKEYILKKYGEEYHQVRGFKSKDKSKSKKPGAPQEAHEAIRPTYLEDEKEPDPEDFDSVSIKVYQAIKRRTLATQMSNAKVANQSIKIGPIEFIQKNNKVVWDGFMVLFPELQKKDEFCDLKKSTELSPLKFRANQSFKDPPPRFNEGSIVKKLETLGVGRPSTYASIINTNVFRGYLEMKNHEGLQKEKISLEWVIKKKLKKKVSKVKIGNSKHVLTPTERGIKISHYLRDKFGFMLEADYTAEMEKSLDLIAKKKKTYPEVLKTFFDAFYPVVVEEKKKPKAYSSEDSDSTKTYKKKEVKVYRTLKDGTEIRLSKVGYYGYHPKKKIVYNFPNPNPKIFKLEEYTDEKLYEIRKVFKKY